MKVENKVIKEGRKFKVIRLVGRCFTYLVLPKDIETPTFYTTEKEVYDIFLDKELDL